MRTSSLPSRSDLALIRARARPSRSTQRLTTSTAKRCGSGTERNVGQARLAGVTYRPSRVSMGMRDPRLLRPVGVDEVVPGGIRVDPLDSRCLVVAFDPTGAGRP